MSDHIGLPEADSRGKLLQDLSYGGFYGYANARGMSFAFPSTLEFEDAALHDVMNRAFAIAASEAETSLDEIRYKMDGLISSLSNGKISKSLVENSVIESVITEEFEAAFEEELKQAANDYETLKLYTSKVRDLLVRAYGLASWMWGHVPVKYITIEYGDKMNALYNEMTELGIEVEQ